MRRGHQDVKIYGIQDRRSHPLATKPWLVRWAVEGQQRSRAFRTKAEGDRYRAMLLVAHRDGDHFDRSTGEPESWKPQPVDLPVHLWARRWIAEQWAEWQPRTRVSAIEALARFIPAVAHEGSTPPKGMRAYIVVTLEPGVDVDSSSPHEDWLTRVMPAIGALDRVRLAEVDRQLGLGDDGRPFAASTASRYRKVARACVRRAVELELLPTDPWPPPTRGRGQRKASRLRRHVGIRALPSPETMAMAIDAIVSHQPGSRVYRVMTAVAYYAGLRPSEVVMLRRHSLMLPPSGWGRIDVTEADISNDEPGEPKTGPRSVPIPPVLVNILQLWVDEHRFEGDALIFRTRNDKRPTGSNWTRSWHRALAASGQPPLRVYDCRHAAATTWLKAGVPLGEVARRLGHSVETLVSTYVGAIVGDEERSNERIQLILDGAQQDVGGHR